MHHATGRWIGVGVWLACAAILAAQPPAGKADKPGMKAPPGGKEAPAAPPTEAKKPPLPLLPQEPLPIGMDAATRAAIDAARTEREAPPADAVRRLARKFFADLNDPALPDPAKFRVDFIQQNIAGEKGAFGEAVRAALVANAPDFLFGNVAPRTSVIAQVNVLFTLIDMDIATKADPNPRNAANGAGVYVETLAHEETMHRGVLAVAIVGMLQAKQLGISSAEQERAAVVGAMRWAKRPAPAKTVIAPSTGFEEELIKLFGEVGRQGSDANAENTDIADYLGSAVLDETLDRRVRLLAAVSLGRLRPKDFAARNFNAEVQTYLVGKGVADGIDWIEDKKNAGGGQAQNDAKYFASRIALAFDTLQDQTKGGGAEAAARELVEAGKRAVFDLYDGKKGDSRDVRAWVAKSTPAQLRFNPRSPVLKIKVPEIPPAPVQAPKEPTKDAAKPAGNADGK